MCCTQHDVSQNLQEMKGKYVCQQLIQGQQLDDRRIEQAQQEQSVMACTSVRCLCQSSLQLT
jgi:hypothetical protein